MTLEGERVLLRIFLGESDRFEEAPLWEAIVRRLQEGKFAGATVLRGLAGFGAKNVLHPAAGLRLSSDLPVIIETVEEEAKIRAFLPALEAMMGDGLVTLERARVILHRG